MTARGPDNLDVERLNAQGRRAVIVDANRSRYARLREQGLCTRGASHGPAVDGGCLCAGCRVDRRLDQREYYRNTRTVGRENNCTRCGGVEHNARSCDETPLPGWAGPKTAKLERERGKRAARKKAGVCIVNAKHGPAMRGRTRCKSCAMKRRKVAS